MRIEVIFFLSFIAALLLGFVLRPYLIDAKEPSSKIEFEFMNFNLIQTDTEGFKSSIIGDSAQRYPDLLLLHNPLAFDKDGNEVRSQAAKMIENDIYLDEDVIITTPDGIQLYSQSVLYNSTNQYFESFTPFEAIYGEHLFVGEKLWYQNGVIDSTNVKATIKVDE